MKKKNVDQLLLSGAAGQLSFCAQSSSPIPGKKSMQIKKYLYLCRNYFNVEKLFLIDDDFICYFPYCGSICFNSGHNVQTY